MTSGAHTLLTSASSRLNSYEANVTQYEKLERLISLINKAKTLHPFGINKRDEAR